VIKSNSERKKSLTPFKMGKEPQDFIIILNEIGPGTGTDYKLQFHIGTLIPTRIHIPKGVDES
jgi:hypothetical protein